MSEQTTILGKTPDEAARRDAIHFAVIPVFAMELLKPGEHVGIVDSNEKGFFVASGAKELIGIVDPFIKRNVEVWEKVWLMLYPNTITNLWHTWTHPAFAPNILKNR